MKEGTGCATRHVIINNDLDIIVARLRAREVAREIGFGTVDQARISLAAGELARVLAHQLALAGQGKIVISSIDTDGYTGIQVTSVGPCNNTTMQPGAVDNGDWQQAISLVDKGVVENRGHNEVHVTLMKWLRKEVIS